MSAWSNPSNAAAEDASNATASVGGGVSTHYLKATNFGFSIPSGATIDGIVAEAKKAEVLSTDDIFDSRVRIVKGGTVGSTDKSSGAEWPTALAYTTYGGAADLWGETWSHADVNASDFGFVIACTSTGAGSAQVDHMRITVYYTPAGGSLPVFQRRTRTFRRSF